MELQNNNDLQDNLISEFAEIMLDEFLPKIKKFLPRIIEMTEKDNTILKPDEIAILSKNKAGKLIFIVTKKTNFELKVDVTNDEETMIYTFNSVINNAIQQVVKNRLK